MEIKGQIAIELILLVGFILVVIMGIASFFGENVELNQAMTAARSGAISGANMDSFAIYPKETYNENIKDHLRLLSPSSIKIININYINKGYDAKYNKILIQLQITASVSNVLDASDRNVLGDRLNFYVRKSISESFGTNNQTNSLFNPAFSNKYLFTTADVKWI